MPSSVKILKKVISKSAKNERMRQNGHEHRVLRHRTPPKTYLFGPKLFWLAYGIRHEFRKVQNWLSLKREQTLG